MKNHLAMSKFISIKSFLCLVILGYVLVATFPGEYRAIHSGLDPSWVWALNYLPGSHYVFGRDIVFTYGPLGYLIHPLNIGSNLIKAAAFRLIVHIVLGILLYYHLRKNNVALSSVIFSIAYIISVAICSYEYQLLIVVGLSLISLLSIQDKRWWYLVASFSAFFSAALLLVKFNIGVASLSMVIAFNGIWYSSKDLRKNNAHLAILLMGSVYLCTLFILSAKYMDSFRSFVRWVRASLDIANGYNVAMSIVGPKAVLGLGLLASFVYIVLILIVKKVKKLRSPLYHIGLVFAPALFFSFKHGFVRQDGHAIMFFSFILAVLSLFILASSNVRDLKISVAAFLCVLILTLPVIKLIFGSFPRYGEIVWGKKGWSNIVSLVHLQDVRNELDRQSELNLQKDRLPQELKSYIKQNGGTVDVLPWEIVYCPANGLPWNPNPVLQTYSAYTRFLDLWSAEHFEGENAPRFLIVEFKSIDGRHVLLDTPASWKEILENYQLLIRHQDTGIILLKRKTLSPYEKSNVKIIGNEKVSLNEWISIPESNRVVFADLDLRLRPIGSITKTLFRIPPVYIDLIYESGKILTYRLIPDTAQNGVLINYLPASSEDLAKLLNGFSEDRVTKFRISGPGTFYYDKSVHLTWEESSFKIKYMPPERLDFKKLALVGYNTLFSLDSINGRILPHYVLVSNREEQTITISGWAVDQQAQKEAGGVFVTIDDKLDIPAIYGLDRKDVADHFQNERYRFTGFSVSFPTSILEKGRHTVSLKIVTADKKAYYVADPKIVLEIK